MKKIALLAAVAGITAGVVPGIASAGPEGPDGVTVSKNGVTIDTGIRCVTEPCPSYIVISIPPNKV